MAEEMQGESRRKVMWFCVAIIVVIIGFIAGYLGVFDWEDDSNE